MEEYKKKTNTGDDVIIRVHPARPHPPPTAVLFGWLASKHKNVAKYSAIYEAMGYNTVQLIAPASTVFALHPRASARFLLSVLRILSADHRLTAGGVAFQMFSNGGAICAPHLSAMFAREYPDLIKADDEIVVSKVKDAMAAVVFDSAPAFLHITTGARAINEGMHVPHGLPSALVTILFAILCVFQWLFFIDLQSWFWDSLTSAHYACPEQYIFSSADHLIDFHKLDALVERRRQDGHDVRAFKVDDAHHVLILRKYPHKYVEVIRSVNEWGVNAWRSKANLSPWSLDTPPSR